MKAKAFPQGLGENSVRFEQTALHYVTPDSLWSSVALIRCMRLSYGKAHKWLCLVQRDRKFGYAPVGGCVANLRHPVFLCQSELGIAAVEHLPSPIYGASRSLEVLVRTFLSKATSNAAAPGTVFS
jgi:hypothetical protein